MVKKTCIVISIVLGVLFAMTVQAGPIMDHKQFISIPNISENGKEQLTKIRVNVGPNVQINAHQLPFPNGLIGRSETSITSVDGQHLVAGYNDAQGFCGEPFGAPCTPNPNPGLSGYAFSSNRGLTWTDEGSPPMFNNVYTLGDPWLDSGNNTVYFSNVIVNNVTAEFLGIGIFRGNFNNDTSFKWNDVHIIDSPKNAKNPGSDLYDKDAIAVSKDGNNAYVSVTNFQELCGKPMAGLGQIEVWRTNNGGDIWNGPSIVGPDTSVASCGSKGILQTNSYPAIGPNGEVYVVWQEDPTFPIPSLHGNILFSRSLNEGISFEKPINVVDFNSTLFDKPNGYNRQVFLNNPSIAVAASGKNKGRIYISFYSAMNTVSSTPSIVSIQTYITFSDDKGSTWSDPKAIVSEIPNTGIKRFWPSVTIDPKGDLNIIYLESKDNLTDSLVNTFLVRSTDGGITFNTPIKISTVTSDWGTAISDIVPNFGDYLGSDRKGNILYPIWADARNGEPDVFGSFVK